MLIKRRDKTGELEQKFTDSLAVMWAGKLRDGETTLEDVPEYLRADIEILLQQTGS